MYDDSYGLECFIKLSIRCANRMQSCYEHHPPSSITLLLRRPEVTRTPEPGNKPMQIDTNWLSFAERQRQLTQGFCLYFGAGGHVISSCPIRPPRPMVSVIKPTIINMQPLTTVVIILAASNVSIPVHALFYSGTASNFISRSLCH